MQQPLASRLFLVTALALCLVAAGIAQTTGTISGLIKDDENREGIPYVNVTVKGTSYGAASDERGRFAISNLPPGMYVVSASAVGFKTQENQVRVEAGVNVNLDLYLVHSTVELSEVLVYGASLRRERITEAPSSVSIIEANEIARSGSHGQLPKLLEAEPGIDMVQSGLYDFNLNTRGFNSTLNRRVLILLDGRDLGTAFLGATEWNGLSVPLEELGRIELVRGPGSALYGANAYNGVLNITSVPPRASQGTRIIAGYGDPTAFRADARHAGAMGRWSYRLNLGGISGKTFSTIRTGRQFEYPGLNPFLNNEVVDLNTDPVLSAYVSARVDYEYEGGGSSTVEGGISQVENEVIVTGIGRVQVQKAQRPWARVSYTGHSFNLLGWTSGRKNVQPERSLSTGLPLIQNATITHFEGQYSFSALENSLFVVAGASQRFVSIDTEGTLMLSPRDDNMTGVFAQIEYRISSTLKALLAGRWDRSTLHPSQFSPKAALVWSFAPGHSIRGTFNQAFQSPNYSELYLHVKHPTSPLAYYGNLTEPRDLTGFVGGAQPGPRKDLTVEKVTGYELGYKGVFENSLFLTVDAYYSELKDFVTDLAVGVNPRFPAAGGTYQSGETRTIWSYANAGLVNEAGIEIGGNYYLSDQWLVRASGAYYSFEVVSKDANDVLLPNSPKYRLSGGITYSHPAGLEVGVTAKYVPTFEWAAGIYRGMVAAYTLVDLTGSYSVTKNLSLNLNISNIADRKHYQVFGGSLLGRRTFLVASYTL